MFKAGFDRYHIILTSLIVSVSLLSCSHKNEAETQSDTYSEIGQIEIDLPALYTGILPCADCPGVDYSLILEEGRFVEISQYMERSTKRFEETGIWTLNGDTLIISQNDSSNFRKQFLFDEKKLILLHSQGQQIAGDLANKYVLERAGNQPEIRNHLQKLANQGITFFAGGNEPFWVIRIDSMNHLTYEIPEDSLKFDVTKVSSDGYRTVFRTRSGSHRLKVESTDHYCRDSMSGYLFPLEVSVYMQTGQPDTLTGCGAFLK